jgi:hypothetical protein
VDLWRAGLGGALIAGVVESGYAGHSGFRAGCVSVCPALCVPSAPGTLYQSALRTDGVLGADGVLRVHSARPKASPAPIERPKASSAPNRRPEESLAPMERGRRCAAVCWRGADLSRADGRSAGRWRLVEGSVLRTESGAADLACRTRSAACDSWGALRRWSSVLGRHAISLRRLGPAAFGLACCCGGDRGPGRPDWLGGDAELPGEGGRWSGGFDLWARAGGGVWGMIRCGATESAASSADSLAGNGIGAGAGWCRGR